MGDRAVVPMATKQAEEKLQKSGFQLGRTWELLLGWGMYCPGKQECPSLEVSDISKYCWGWSKGTQIPGSICSEGQMTFQCHAVVGGYPWRRFNTHMLGKQVVGVVYSWLSKYSCSFGIELVSIHNVWKSMIQTIRSQLPKMDRYVYTGFRTVQLYCLWLWMILFFASCICFL
jgi:hypothetical protein